MCEQKREQKEAQAHTRVFDADSMTTMMLWRRITHNYVNHSFVKEVGKSIIPKNESSVDIEVSSVQMWQIST